MDYYLSAPISDLFLWIDEVNKEIERENHQMEELRKTAGNRRHK